MSTNVTSPAGRYIVSFIHHEARTAAFSRSHRGVDLAPMAEHHFKNIPAVSGTFTSEALEILQETDSLGVKFIEKDTLGAAYGGPDSSVLAPTGELQCVVVQMMKLEAQ